MFYTNTFIIFFVLFISACSTKQYDKNFKQISQANLKEISFDEINGFYEDDLELAFNVFKKSCMKAKRYKLFHDVCEKSNSDTNAKDFFIKNFTPYMLYSKNNKNIGLITGYYEPLLYGSKIKNNRYKYPIYKVPNDLISVHLGSIYPKLKDYRLRGKIKNNKLIAYEERKNIKYKSNLEVITYVDNKIDLFFLHIQGSGKVKLDTGEIINIAYANQNGRKYFAIGKYFIKNKLIKRKNISLQSIKKYLYEHPFEVDKILNLNKSYVFFSQSSKSATGALGVELTAKRNLAVDKKYIPLGMPVFINTNNPQNRQDINRLMVASDVGGAIKGEIRADFFWGHGKEAEHLAGLMKEKGTLILLIPKK